MTDPDTSPSRATRSVAAVWSPLWRCAQWWPFWRRYTGLAVCEAIRPATRPAGRRSQPPRGSRRWRMAKSPPLAVAQTPFRVPDLAFKDAAGRERTLADWRGRTRAAQPVGHLVRALPQGNAGARRARRRPRRPEIRGRRRQYRHPRSRKSRRPSSRRSASPTSPITPIRQRQGIPGPESCRQGLRHADDAHRRSRGLRDRQHGRPRANGRATTAAS